MTVLSAQSIRFYCFPPGPDAMIFPFEERMDHAASDMTYGLGPCTYDVRLHQEVLLRPGDFCLASTVERFRLPLNVCGTVMDKSTLARVGIAVQNTHLDPGWGGCLTLELSNHGHVVRHLPAGSPIAQIKFEFLDFLTNVPYVGKYQDQPSEPVEAR